MLHEFQLSPKKSSPGRPPQLGGGGGLTGFWGVRLDMLGDQERP